MHQLNSLYNQRQVVAVCMESKVVTMPMLDEVTADLRLVWPESTEPALG